jgi:hypothetical protein
MGKRAVVGFAAAALALLAAGPGPAAIGPSTIRVTSVQVRLQTSGGDGTGGVQAIRVTLYNPSVTSSSIGRGDTLCTFLDRRTRMCTATYSLPRGKLVVSGVVTTRLLYEIAIVGGTGLYDNARGSLTVTATKFRPRHEVLVFRLSG